MLLFYLVSMSGKLVEYSSHAVKLLLSWIPYAFRWMPCAIHSESHKQQTKLINLRFSATRSQKALPLWIYGISKLLKVKASPKKNTSSFGHMWPVPQHISICYFFGIVRSGFNLREGVDKKDTSRKFCYKLVMRYTELRLTFDSSLNILVQCSVIPVIEMTS